MIKLLAVTVVCVGIMCGGLYAQNTFVKEVDGYKIMVTTDMKYDGWVLNIYSIKAEIFKNGNRVNLCIGDLDCVHCPGSEKEWIKTLPDVDFVCAESSPTINTFF